MSDTEPDSYIIDRGSAGLFLYAMGDGPEDERLIASADRDKRHSLMVLAAELGCIIGTPEDAAPYTDQAVPR